MTWPRGLPRTSAALTAAVAIAAAALVARAPSPGHGLILGAIVALGTVPAAAGLAVARHQEHSLLGVLLVLPGLLAVVGLTLAVAEDVAAGPRWGDYLTVASQGAWVLVYVVVVIPLLFFPDGRLSSRSARWLFPVILVNAAVFMVTAATAAGPFLPPNELAPHVFGTMPGPLTAVLAAVSLPAVPVTLVAVVVDVVRRCQRSDPLRRRQYRVLALAAALLPVTLLAAWLSYALIGNADVVLATGLTLAYLAVPLLVAVAICRPDLFDVDRALVAAVTRSILAAGLLTIFTAANVLAGVVLSRRAPAVAVAVTAGVAFAMAPVGRRLQRRVDAWLYPARSAAYAAIEDLHQQTLRAEAGPEQLQQRLGEALGDPTLVVGYRTPSLGDLVDAAGIPMNLPATGIDIELGTQRVGLLSTSAPISAALGRDLASRAAPLVELVRLRVELRQALMEAEESRSRLLLVGYEERTRLERDLHDGAQQRLVALGMALRLAQRRLGRGVDVSDVLDEAVAELGTAVSELRQLAHGIRPSCLDDGLVPALSHLVSSTPLPITVKVTAGELDPDLETTAYYVAAEAITNAVKHAHADHITLEVDTVAGRLHVRVRDDGIGQAKLVAGSGLAGLADRVGAHGGHLAVDSLSGAGTVVEAVLPCAS